MQIVLIVVVVVFDLSPHLTHLAVKAAAYFSY